MGIFIKRIIFIFALILVAASFTHIHISADEGDGPEARSATFDRYIISFDPNGGTFPESETAEGIRFVRIGETETDLPPDPTRANYVFSGWQFLNSGAMLEANYIVATENFQLQAVWVHYTDAPDATPAASPTPGAGASPTPGASPSPTPAGPTPTPNKDAQRPNPTTNPIAISFMIFGAVLVLGMSAFGVIKLSVRHAEATGRYKVDASRYNREARLQDYLDEDM